MPQHGSAVVVGTILGHVATAIHGGGTVPAANSRYRKNAAGTVDVIGPGFAESWKTGQFSGDPSSRNQVTGGKAFALHDPVPPGMFGIRSRGMQACHGACIAACSCALLHV